MGHICKNCEKTGRLFATHSFTNFTKGKTGQELKDVLALPCGGNITQSKEMYFEAYKSAHGKLQVSCSDNYLLF